MFYCDGSQWTLDLNFEVSFAKQDSYFSSFLPAMASNHTSMNNNSCCQESLSSYLAGFALKHSNVLIVGGAKIHSLLSAHHLIGAYFLATESDKRMRLLIRPYGMCKTSTNCLCLPYSMRKLLYLYMCVIMYVCMYIS